MDDLQSHLEKILASKGFVGAPRLRRFLEHVVTKTLKHETADLHLSAIAYDLWGNPQKTNDVKVCASKTRDRLILFYAENGKDERLRIEFSEGSYVPTITDNTQVRVALYSKSELSKREVEIINQVFARRQYKCYAAEPGLIDYSRRAVRLPIEEENVSIEFKRDERGRRVLEIVSDKLQAPEEELSDAALNELVVTLLQGQNPAGENIFSYIQLTVRSFIALVRRMQDGRDFRPRDFGIVIASGSGCPTPELEQQMRSQHNLVDTPSLLCVPDTA